MSSLTSIGPETWEILNRAYPQVIDTDPLKKIQLIFKAAVGSRDLNTIRTIFNIPGIDQDRLLRLVGKTLSQLNDQIGYGEQARANILRRYV